MRGLFRWLLEPSDSNKGPGCANALLKCHICGAEIRGEERVCPVCGFATTAVQGNPETLWNDSRIPKVVGNHDETTETIDTPAGIDPSRAEDWYEKARDECRNGQNEEAIAFLKKACQLDGLYASFANMEYDFEPLRNDPRFAELLRKRREELKEHPNPQFYSIDPSDSAC